VQFEITQATRDAVQKWIKQAGLKSEGFVRSCGLRQESRHPPALAN